MVEHEVTTVRTLWKGVPGRRRTVLRRQRQRNAGRKSQEPCLFKGKDMSIKAHLNKLDRDRLKIRETGPMAKQSYLMLTLKGEGKGGGGAGGKYGKYQLKS